MGFIFSEIMVDYQEDKTDIQWSEMKCKRNSASILSLHHC